MIDLRCPNCRASASLPLGMTCRDHQPVPYCFSCADTGTVESDGAHGDIVTVPCPDCADWRPRPAVEPTDR